MDLKISLIPERTEGCDVLSADPGQLTLRTISKNALVTLPALGADEIVSSQRLLSAAISFDSNEVQRFYVKFFDGNGNQRFQYDVMLMPTVKADFVFRLKYLDGNLLFLPMEPGTLKSMTSGSIRPDEIRQLKLAFCGEGVTYTIENLRFTDDEPPFRPAERVMCDGFGQWNAREWEGKTHSLDELRKTLDSELSEADGQPSDADKYGGDRRYRIAEPSDRFCCVRKDGKWWLATPDGNAFFSLGVFGVYPGEYGWIRGNEKYIGKLPPTDGEFSEAWTFAENEELYRRKFSGLFPADTRLYSFATANLIRVWGSDWRKNWTKLTAARMRRWSMNTLSMFSDREFIRESGIPYVIMLHRYPTTERRIYREFPDVFDPDYERASEVYASQLSEHAENPRFIGYFMNNEPTFAWHNSWALAEKVLEGGEKLHSHRVLVEWLRERYGTIGALNEAWQTSLAGFEALREPLLRAGELSDKARADLTDFSVILMRRYVEIPAKLCRKAAPKRLNLGMRFAGINQLVLGTIDLFDVYSFNHYSRDPSEMLRKVASNADMPILIGEFHFGATDAGLPSGGVVNASTQKGRSEAYRHYMTCAAAHPNCIGAHWFAWNDQPFWGRYDCENHGFGMVDICSRPYPLFTQTVREVNSGIIERRMENN